MSGKKWQPIPQVGRVNVDADVRAEIEAHLEMQVQELIQDGHAPEAARAEALRRFGDRRVVEREVLVIERKAEGERRRSQIVSDFSIDARIALRQLRRQPMFAFVAIAIMALGIGANAAVFAVVDGALLRPLPLEGDRLVWVYEGTDASNRSNPTLVEFRAVESQTRMLSSVMAGYGTAFTIQSGDDPEQVIGGVVTGDPRGVFGVDPIAGRWFTREEIESGARVVLLDEGYWRTRLGSRNDIIGEPMRINNDVYTVVGVLPAAANLLRPGSDVALWTIMREEQWMTPALHFLRVVGRLAPGLELEEARERLPAVNAALQEQQGDAHTLSIVPAREVLVGDSRKMLLMIAGAVLLLLLIVCSNLANLFFSRALERGREFAVRASLGAARWRVLRQVLTEGLVLGVLGGVGGLILSYSFVGVVRAMAAGAGALAPSSRVDPRVVGFTLALSMMVGLLFSAWPALRAAKFDVAGAIRDGDSRTAGGRGAWRRRRALVALEVAMCFLLLTAAGLLGRSMLRVVNASPGFSMENVIIAGLSMRGERYETPESRADFMAAYLGRVSSLPGVAAAAIGSNLPLDGGETSGSFEIEGREYTPEQAPNARKRVVSPGYFRALGIPLLRGRDFDARDRLDQPGVVLISQSIATQYFAGEDPIGKRITFNWGPEGLLTIIGVVGDVKHDGLDQPIAAGMLYRAAGQFPHQGGSLVVRAAGDPETVIAAMRRELRAIDPTLALRQPTTMQAVVHDSLATRRTFMVLIAAFAVVALLLAAVGVYAITAQAVAARTREMGVRMALGASRASVVKLLVGDEAIALGIGLAAGIGAAIPATGVLASHLYSVSAHDPSSLIAAALVLVLVALAATLVPARRAALTDVAGVLRN